MAILKSATPSPARQALVDSILAHDAATARPGLVPSHPTGNTPSTSAETTTGTLVEPSSQGPRRALLYALAEAADDDEDIVRAIAENLDVHSMRDVAAKYNTEDLTAIKFSPRSLRSSNNTSVTTPSSSESLATAVAAAEAAKQFHQKLFLKEPTAVLQKMIRDGEISVTGTDSAAAQSAMLTFLEKHPDWDIRSTPVTVPLKQTPPDQTVHAAVTDQLKTLQRVQALTSTPAAIPVLLAAGVKSAAQVAAIPQAHFVTDMPLDDEVARDVHRHATDSTIRSNMMLTTALQAVRGTGIRLIDGADSTRKSRIAKANVVPVASTRSTVDLEELFGSLDYCDCSDCTSVTSPAAYFVELLEFLRNNNLKPNQTPLPPTVGWAGTALERLFQRRPDLADIELTCANTNTVLPYIDLSNEVMESFVVHLSSYVKEADPKQSKIAVFNTSTDDDSSELLAQPRNVNYKAYCILKDAVYPFTLPYHQAIDEIRILLGDLGTSRYKLLSTFQPALNMSSPELADEQQALARACTAEFLLLTQEEYKILTHEAFYSKDYFQLTLKVPHLDDSTYQTNIGILPPNAYWGYDSVPDMTATAEPDELGLTFVNKQFLKRSGITYIDLVNLVETRYVNPNYPTGWALELLDKLRFSYDYLLTLVNGTGTDKYDALIAFLDKNQPLAEVFACLREKYLKDMASSAREKQDPKPPGCNVCNCHCSCCEIWKCWVLRYFELFGKLVVLDSGDGPVFETEGWLVSRVAIPHNNPPQITLRLAVHENFDTSTQNWTDTEIGYLNRDGTITTISSSNFKSTVGYVAPDGTFFDKGTLEPYAQFYSLSQSQNSVVLYSTDKTTMLGSINSTSSKLNLNSKDGALAQFGPIQDTCNIDKVRLIHLDGSQLSVDEFDRMQRFIRLWLKLGWQIDEVDQALFGLYGVPTAITPPTPTPPIVPADVTVTWDDLNDKCSDNNSDDDCTPTPPSSNNCPLHTGADTFTPGPELNIDPTFLDQLVAVKKLLEITGLELTKLLAFWADISTHGSPKSLYQRLFLTPNLISLDPVFQADSNGNYLTYSGTPEMLSAHIPVIMSAFKVRKSTDINTIITLALLKNELTLDNVSIIYRYTLLASVLSVPSAQLPNVGALFGNPFASGATGTLQMLVDWQLMEDANFTLQQVIFVVNGIDNPLQPTGPSVTSVLKVCKSLVDGLSGILTSYPDVATGTVVTTDIVTTAVTLLFNSATTTNIVSVLNGTYIYVTNAPSGLTITVIAALTTKLKYVNTPANPATGASASATVQTTGILTPDETTAAKALSTSVDWGKAIDRLNKQPASWYNDTLLGIFPDDNAAKAVLLAGDVAAVVSTPDPNNPTAPLPPADPGTAPGKMAYFMSFFIPFVRQSLSDQLIFSTMSGVSTVSADLTNLLLTDILKISVAGASPVSALSVLRTLEQIPPVAGDWLGYLIPPSTDQFTFIAMGDTQPAAIILNNVPIPFIMQQADPSNVWFSNPTKLVAGMLYTLFVPGQPASQIQWKTARSAKAPISSSALLPAYATDTTTQVFVELVKAGLLVNGFSLTAEEITYFEANGGDFDGLDFNSVNLAQWKRLAHYTALRRKFNSPTSTLIQLFQWAKLPNADPTILVDQIVASSRWDPVSVAALIAADKFNLTTPATFCNEIPLCKLKPALDIVTQVAVDVNTLFTWAKPLSKFWVCRSIADGIRKVIRARFVLSDWEQVVKPLNNKLREDQKNALIQYLLVQPVLMERNVVDADSLFEFFLIDVQMSSCLQTSRIKQAISTAQLFVQRCLLGLELDDTGTALRIDAIRWNWMASFVVWQANRKVFLYPENWLVPTLRDDKTPFYLQLESELLQKDVNSQNVVIAFQNYLYSLDQVSNMQVEGVFVQSSANTDTIVHIVSRTRAAPFTYWYRQLNSSKGLWTAWEQLQTDIPNYLVESQDGVVRENGTFVAPVVWQGRIFVFFPQFAKKTVASVVTTDKTQSMQSLGAAMPPDTSQAVTFWEVKMCMSERVELGKWSPKIVSSDSAYEKLSPTDLLTYTLPTLDTFLIIPRVVLQTTGDSILSIDVLRNSGETGVGRFDFLTGKLTKSVNAPAVFSSGIGAYDFGFNTTSDTLHSWQATTDSGSPDFYSKTPFASYPSGLQTAIVKMDYSDNISTDNEVTFYHTFAHNLVGQLSTTNNLDSVFTYYATGVHQTDLGDAFGSNPFTIYHEGRKPYAIYNWEVALHAPLALVDKLLQQNQFAQALTMLQYCFNPMVNSNDPKQCWQFRPFQEIVAKDYLENFFASLLPGVENSQITEWRDNAFEPHVVARSRPVSYMKYVVMKYIEIMIAYGDYYFRQNTLETLPLAINCYVIASHVYGPAGQKIPKRGTTEAETYRRLCNRLDAFDNAAVDLELHFPFSNQISVQTPIGFTGLVDTPVNLPNIFGSATIRYFCIPDNPQLTALRATIDDRLFKLRHCQDINGVVQKLPLFEPPIDPGLLVAATAAGLSISSVLNDLDAPMPNYRFYYLLQKAHEVCADLKALVGGFLTAMEKKDSEGLALLRQTHEIQIGELVMEIKKRQLDEANASLDGLQQNRLTPAYRLRYYLSLLGEDLSLVPADVTSDWQELANSIEAPADDGGLKLISSEAEEFDKAHTAKDLNLAVGVVESLVALFQVLPNIAAHATPLGVGAAVQWGFPFLANAGTAVARGVRTAADYLSAESSLAGRRTGFLRNVQERIFQANVAGYEIKNIDKQILSQQIRQDIAARDINNQQQIIDNSRAVQDYLTSKYTNEQLYSFLVDQSRALCYQTYTLAYDLSKRAEKTYHFERPLEADTSFIQFGYWDPARDGLLSGDRLSLALRQLEAAYQAKRGYDYEVSKFVSLRLTSPLELIKLRETGTCELVVPEVLLDMDFPGHYLRKIKTVSLTIPCITGPYTSINCTLRLLENKYRISAIAKDKGAYPENLDSDTGTDERFSTTTVPISAIAASNAQNDSGLFELSFKDERYVPFEGAGVISRWQLTLPPTFHQFDYTTITDAILNIRYTACEGGSDLATAASGAVGDFVKSVEDLSQEQGLFAVFDLKSQFATQWYQAATPLPTDPSGAITPPPRTIVMPGVASLLPAYTRSAKKLTATDIYLFSTTALPISTITLAPSANVSLAISFDDSGLTIGSMQEYDALGVTLAIGDWTLAITDQTAVLDRIWMVVRYTIN